MCKYGLYRKEGAITQSSDEVQESRNVFNNGNLGNLQNSNWKKIYPDVWDTIRTDIL